MKKLAVIISHPIQYYSPLFQLLNKRGKIQLKVFYTLERGSELFDEGFAKNISWDIPLLDGYEYCFVSNNGRLKKSFWHVRNPTLKLEIKKWGADFILIFGWTYWSHLNVMLSFTNKIPILFRGDSNLLDKNSIFKAWLRKAWLSWIYKYIDYGLYVGENNKKYYLEYGVGLERLVFAPHAIDNERFYDSPIHLYSDQALELRKDLGYNEEQFVFMFSGKLEDKKNPILLLNAFKKLSYVNIRLLYVGSGPLEQELKKQASSDSRIKFMNFQNQSIMPAIYRIADVVVVPSKGPGETWGLVVNEAMASGRALLVSDMVGCAVDLIKPSENGYTFESGSVNDLINKMALMLNQKNACQIMGLNAHKTINNWSFANIAINLEDHLNSINV